MGGEGDVADARGAVDVMAGEGVAVGARRARLRSRDDANASKSSHCSTGHRGRGLSSGERPAEVSGLVFSGWL